MKRFSVLFLLVVWLISCGKNPQGNIHKVSDKKELKAAISQAQPGDQIVMTNGIWKDVQIRFVANGRADRPITLRAESPGEVLIQGHSDLKLGGNYLVVEGLYFTNGHTPSNAVIDFRVNKKLIANNCRVTSCVIEDYNQPRRYSPDHWVEFWGRHNQLDHCYLAGKSNQGPTIRVFLKGNEHIYNYHRIVQNYFGPRPRKGGPRGETLQIGDSYTSMTPSHLLVSQNFFDRCNGEVEIISSKSNFNEFRNNVFYHCEGSLVMRHGNYCHVDGNFFIGDSASLFNGGIRVINTGHWITNNYFYQINGKEFRSPLAVMNGIPKSPLNRYNQVTDVVVAYNTWVDCNTPWQISVGANIDKTDVLPASEIRSARPERTVIANNLIYNHQARNQLLKAYDKVDGVQFENNLYNNQNKKPDLPKGIIPGEFKLKEALPGIFIPSEQDEEVLAKIYNGFGFEEITKDIWGNSRNDHNMAGAMIAAPGQGDQIFDKKNYGPKWFNLQPNRKAENRVEKVATETELRSKLAQATDHDILELLPGKYELTTSLPIDKFITLRAEGEGVQLVYKGRTNTPAFLLSGGADLVLQNIQLTGQEHQQAFSPKLDSMYSAYRLKVQNCRIDGFDHVLLAYRGSFADSILFDNSKITNCAHGIVLAAETDDKGDYNAEFLTIKNCEFKNVDQDVIHFYRGGYDESTIGGVLSVRDSRFTNCGRKENSRILLKTRGIINVEIINNHFLDNPVGLVALLWGEKDNIHKNNEILRSGEIRVEKYLKQKLVY